MSSTQRSVLPTQRSPVPTAALDTTSGLCFDGETLGHDLAVRDWGHAPHAHVFGQLVYAVAGRAVFEVLDPGRRPSSAWPVEAGRAIWIPPLVWHAARFEVGFVPSSHYLDLKPAAATVRVIEVHRQVREELLAALWGADGGFPATRAALAEQTAAGSAPPPRPRSGPGRRIADHLDAHPDDPRHLEQWARELHTSTASLRRAFKTETGMTWSRWRSQHRLHAAVGLLRGGGSPSRVAAAVGWSDAGLAAALRRELGCTPSQLRLA